ncbi:MAG TPA: hypothetical protein HA348_06380 [Thermoplasmata archaeon]|nr:hypothetical protein [Thermoplasmata archaeon]
MAISLLVVLVCSVGIAIAQDAQDPNEKDIVITAPLSPIEEGSVYPIPSSSLIVHEKGLTRVYDPEGKSILTVNDSNVPSIATPTGLMKVTHVHHVPSGSKIVDPPGSNVTKVYDDNGTLILTVISENTSKRSTIPGYENWIEWAQDLWVWELWEFTAEWNVPSSPPSPEGDTVDFLFNGIEPLLGGSIIQPVLEWNYGGSGRWTAAPWCVSGSDTYRGTPPIDVDVNDHLEGILVWHDAVDKWTIGIYDHTKGTYKFIEKYCGIDPDTVRTYVTLEGYGVYDDSDVPGDTTFYNMIFEDANENPVDIDWTPKVNEDWEEKLTGLNVHVYSDHKVKLETAN